jgi:hypothetical protein
VASIKVSVADADRTSGKEAISGKKLPKNGKPFFIPSPILKA